MNGRVTYGDADLFLQGFRLRGVQNHSARSSADRAPVISLGTGYVNSVPTKNIQASWSFDRYIISQSDPVTGLLLNNNLSGHTRYFPSQANYTGRFIFQKGHVSRYAFSAQVGGLPTLSTDITVLGRAGRETFTPQESPTNITLDIVKSNDLHLNVSGSSTNRIQSVEWEVSLPRNQTKGIGGPENYLLTLQKPISIVSTFSMEVDDYESKNVFDILCQDETQDLTFLFKDCSQSSTIRTFNAPSSKLVDFSHQGEIGQNMTANLQYLSEINDTGDLMGVLFS